ncbi:MAG: 6-bladed beta-propeller [Breznakibacter sp.]
MKYLSIIFALVLLFSCTNRKNKDVKKRTVKIEEAKAYVFSDIFDSLTIYPLETNDSSLITEIDKVIFSDGQIFILDKRQLSVVTFDSFGKFVSRLRKIGRGPDEYVGIEDFTFDSRKGNLILLNWCTLKTYGLDGRLLEQFHINEKGIKALNRFEIINDDLMAFLRYHEDEGLVLYSRNQKKILETKHIVPKWTRNKIPFNSLNPFFNNSGDIVYIEGFSNKIYKIDENGCNLKYEWDFPGKNFNYDILKSQIESISSINKIEDQISFYLKNYVLGFNYNCENETWIITNCMSEGSQLTILFNKKTTKSVIIKGNLSMLFSSNVYLDKNNQIFTIVDPRTLKYLPQNWFSEEVKSTIDNIDVMDNPVVLKFSIKNDGYKHN